MDLIQPSISKIEEKEFVRRVVGSLHTRERLFNINDFPPNAIIRCEEELPSSEGKTQGDIDILLVSPTDPGDTVAIQVKRFKVSMEVVANASEPYERKSLRDRQAEAFVAHMTARFGKGVEQANKNLQFGLRRSTCGFSFKSIPVRKTMADSPTPARIHC